MNKYSTLMDNIVSEIEGKISLKLNKEGNIETDINYTKCSIKMLNDDNSTVWVTWGHYNCSLRKLPAVALATIADNVL